MKRNYFYVFFWLLFINLITNCALISNTLNSNASNVSNNLNTLNPPDKVQNDFWTITTYEQFKSVKQQAHEDLKPILEDLFFVFNLRGSINYSQLEYSSILYHYYKDKLDYIDENYGLPFEAIKGNQVDVEKRAFEVSDKIVGENIIYLREIIVLFDIYQRNVERFQDDATKYDSYKIAKEYATLPKAERDKIEQRVRSSYWFIR